MKTYFKYLFLISFLIAGFFLFQVPSAEGTEGRSIIVTSPSAGETWTKGSTYDITWEATGAEYIYIDVVCGSNAWTFLGSDVKYPASKGSYLWTISDKYPDQIGACYVRVFLVPSPGSPSPGVDYDASDTFTIAEAEVARSITVTSPKAGDVWKYGSTHNITWEATGAEYVHIDVVRRENGYHAYTLFSSNDNISASSGSVSWTIGETWTADQLSGECYIRVFLYPIAWEEGVDYDKSDTFTIGETGEAKSITVTSPNGGETWKSGEKHQITWDSVGVDAVNIYIFDPSISINGSHIATVYVATLGNYDWIIPSVSKLPGGGGSNYKIRIEDADDASTKDESDSYFSIVEGEAKSLYVTSPNGGQEWWIGKTYDITWNSTGIDEINIWLVDEAQENVQCTLSGMCCSTCGNWRSIASNIPAYKGSYPWTVPIDQTTGREYKILIRTVPDNCFDNCPPLDMSDNYFSIAEAGEGQFINVTVPNGGEKWWKGKTYDIRWASSGIENVHIDIAKFGSPSQAWTLVSNVPASKGSYPWTIGSKWKLPDQIPAGDTYKIRVFTYPLPPSGGWIEGVNYDQSDNYFSINEGDEPPPTETSVSGIVTDYSNQPVYEAFIDLHAADHSVGWGAKTDSRGYYFIGNVQPGNYIIDVYPPEGKTDLLRPNSVNITLMENESDTQNFQFLQATKTVKGSITLADGTPVTDAVVKAVRNGKGWSAALTDSSGNYLLKVTGGNWEIHVYPKNPDTANWFYDQPHKQVDFADDKTHEEKIVDIVVSSKTVLPDKAGVQGTVTDPAGQPVEHVEVVIYPSDHSFKRVSVTDSQGKYFISDLDPGAYILEVYLPQELMNFIRPDSRDITLLKGETLTENFQLLAATKTITGKVSFPDGTPLTTDVMVNAFKENAPGWAEGSVDSQGNYTLKLGGGDWMVMPHPKDHETANWSYFEPPKKVTFALDQTTEKAIVNFTVLRADARVTGRVLNPDGSAPDRYKVHVNISSSHGHGGGAKLDDSGTFSTAVPAGSYTLHIFCEDPTLGAPPLDPFSVVKGQTLNLGTIYLIKKNELIKGKVINEQGKGIANVSVEAFRPDEKGYNGTKTDSFGNYDLYVTTGEWMVTVFTDEASGYVYPEPPKQITISVGQTITLNFTLISADAVISGTVQDSTGKVLTDVYGWAFVKKETAMEHEAKPSFGGPIERGTFSFNVPAGTYKVGIHLPPDADYGPGPLVPVTIGSGETVKIVLTVRSNDATIRGHIKDSAGNIITGIKIHVFVGGESGLWQEANLNVSTGEYVIRLSAGTWYLGFHVDPDSGYMSKPPIKEPIVIASGQTVVKDIILIKADSIISGKAVDSNGNPLAHVWVSADSRSFKEEVIGEPPEHFFTNGADTDVNGNFSFPVPQGTYYIHAFLPPEFGYINPEEQKVVVSPGAPGVITLVFRKADSAIYGKVYLGDVGTSPFGTPAFVWAWSEKGGFTETKADDGGNYKLKVAKNDIWHIGAAKGVGIEFYKSKEVIIKIGEQSLIAQDLVLKKLGFAIPQPVSATADAAKLQVISVSGGAEAFIPANALATTGNVTVTIDPDVELAPQGTSKVVGVGYDIKARDEKGEIIETFNTNVTINLPYTDEQLIEAQVNADDLAIGFWDETSAVWRKLDNSVVDKTNRLVVGITNHFTRFALLALPGTPPTGIVDGDVVRSPDAPGMAQFDVYIVKIIGEKKFKRLVLSPHVFESYGHLKWENIELIDQSIMDSHITSDLVRCKDPDAGVDDPKVYKLIPEGDTGTKQWLDMSIERFESLGNDWNSIYFINKVDRDAYVTGSQIQ